MQGTRTAGVQAHYPIPRLVCDIAAGGVVWHYKLKEPLRFSSRLRLSDFAAASIGTPYDWQGAFDARDLAISAVKRWWLGDNGLHELFCSEFVAASWDRAGRGLWANPSHWAPNQLCRTAVADGLCHAPRRIQEADL